MDIDRQQTHRRCEDTDACSAWNRSEVDIVAEINPERNQTQKEKCKIGNHFVSTVFLGDFSNDPDH